MNPKCGLCGRLLLADGTCSHCRLDSLKYIKQVAMTDAELDIARAEEAIRLLPPGTYGLQQLAVNAARLAREGWMPDSLLKEAEHILSMAPSYRREHVLNAILSALRRGMELTRDKIARGPTATWK